MAKPVTIARLRITLEDMDPPVVRQVDVPLTLKLDRLHMVIQAAMPWSNSHLWGFEAGEARWRDAGFGFDDVQPAAKTTLKRAMEDAGSDPLFYIYDYGDTWEHLIEIAEIRDADPGTLYPALVAATGRCPPEDIGGPPGYEHYLEIAADPAHEEYDEMIEWYGEPEDPKEPERDTIQALLKRLAQRWKPRPRKPRS